MSNQPNNEAQLNQATGDPTKTKTIICGVVIAALLHLGSLDASAQSTNYLYSGSQTNVTLNPGTYIITAYGAMGGASHINLYGGGGAEMSAEFNFSTPTTLTLLVGGRGDNAEYNYSGAGGGGGSFVVQGSTPLVVAGGGGGAAAGGVLRARGGDGTVTTFGSAGGGNNGGSGGTGGGGGTGGDPSLTGSFGSFNYGQGAGGGGGFYTDGTGERPVIFYGALEAKGAGGAAVASIVTAPGGGGLSFEDGGAGALSNLGIAANLTGNGGFGGGGGGYSGNSYAFGGGGGGYSGGGGGGAFDTETLIGGGGGGGSFIDSSAIAILSGIGSPADVGFDGEIIITAAPEPASVGLLAIGSLALLRRNRCRQSRAY